MKMLASRELAAAPGKVWRLLEKEGTLVITRDGKPRGILLSTSDDTVIDDVQDQVRARARRAIAQIRLKRVVTDKKWTEAEIAGEIAATRRERR